MRPRSTVHQYEYIREDPRSNDNFLSTTETEQVPNVACDYAHVDASHVPHFSLQENHHQSENQHDGYLCPTGQGIPLRQIYNNKRGPNPSEMEPEVGKQVAFMSMTL